MKKPELNESITMNSRMKTDEGALSVDLECLRLELLLDLSKVVLTTALFGVMIVI